MNPEAFSLAVGEQYARELALKLARCPMNEAARQSEYRDFARVAAEIFRKQKKDWTPSPSAQGPEDGSDGALNNNGGN
jgi:hypothetical protein